MYTTTSFISDWNNKLILDYKHNTFFLWWYKQMRLNRSEYSISAIYVPAIGRCTQYMFSFF